MESKILDFHTHETFAMLHGCYMTGKGASKTVYK